MLAALILAAAVALIAVQPLVLRTWPWLDRYGLPRRPGARQTLWEVLSAAARTLPVPAPPPAPPLPAVEYRTRETWLVPAGWAYDPATDRYRDVATGMTARRDEVLHAATAQVDARFRQQLACAIADGHTQTAANLRQQQMEMDRRRWIADQAAATARGVLNFLP